MPAIGCRTGGNGLRTGQLGAIRIKFGKRDGLDGDASLDARIPGDLHGAETAGTSRANFLGYLGSKRTKKLITSAAVMDTGVICARSRANPASATAGKGALTANAPAAKNPKPK